MKPAQLRELETKLWNTSNQVLDKATFTSAEYAAANGLGQRSARDRLRKLVASGQIIATKTKRMTANGWLCKITAYRLKK